MHPGGESSGAPWSLANGQWPMARVVVLCWVLWLTRSFGLRLADVSLPLWMQFGWRMCHCLCGCSSGIRSQEREGGSLDPSRRGQMDSGNPLSVGARPRPMSEWPPISWGRCVARAQVPGGLGPDALEELCWHALRRGGSAACYARHPRCNSSSSGGDDEAPAQPCAMRQRSKTRRSWALFDCLWGWRQGGGSGSSHTWRLGLPICSPVKAEPPPPTAFHPPPPPSLASGPV